MRVRLQTISRRANGSTASRATEIETAGRRLRLGRSTDNEIFLKDLRVRYHHAEIHVRDHDVVVEAVDDAVVRVDGIGIGRAVLSEDTPVEVGPYRLAIGPAEAGYDLALTLELVVPPPEDRPEALVAPERVRFNPGLLGRRPLSWALFTAVLVVALVLPYLAFRPDGSAGSTASAPSRFASFDRVWSSGELSDPHKALGGDCEACHRQAFQWVAKEACGSCHRDTRHHFDTERFTFAGFAPDECTGCHIEHEGPAGAIPAFASLCTDCHADLDEAAPLRGPPTALINVTDFGADHPQFRPSVPTDPATGAVARVAIGSEPFPREVSNLKFPHGVHLVDDALADACRAPGGSAAASGHLDPITARRCNVAKRAIAAGRPSAAVGCGDCHRPEPGGATMRPVSMREHCQDCHTLWLDEAEGRILPHGEPEEVHALLDDYFAAKALRGELAVPAQPGGQASSRDLRRRVGAPATEEQRRTVLRTASNIAAQRMGIVLGPSGLCGQCHVTRKVVDAPRPRWIVNAVAVTPVWLPKARFDHESHRTEACTSCHAAPRSTASGDVLLPGIEVCWGCHEGEGATAAVPSSCGMCHVYHQEGLGPILAAQRPGTTDDRENRTRNARNNTSP